MASTSVKVTGLRELQRAFSKMSGDVSKELRKELRHAADPVKQLAESKSLSSIRNMPASPRWAGMRIGVTAKGVYIAPRSRNRGGSGRANLKGLLLDQAMFPAVEAKQAEIVEGVGRMFDNLAGDNGF